MFKEKLTWYSCEENMIYLSKFFWKDNKVQEDTLQLENTEYNELFAKNEDYITTIEYPDDDIWHYNYESRLDWKIWKSDDLIKRYFDHYPAKEYYNEILSEKMMDMDELEEILYNGTKEKIKKVLEDYKVSYEYAEEYKSFGITSLILNETCKGYKSHYVPQCVKFFGKKYTYKS